MVFVSTSIKNTFKYSKNESSLEFPFYRLSFHISILKTIDNDSTVIPYNRYVISRKTDSVYFTESEGKKWSKPIQSLHKNKKFKHK